MIAIMPETRPEFISMFPITQECERRDPSYFVLHTAQHNSYKMNWARFEELKLTKPKYTPDVDFGTHGEQTTKILTGIRQVLLTEKLNVVPVQGNTNTVMTGDPAASKLQIKVGHIETGLGRFDWEMPEKINLVVVDHISEYRFTQTEKSENYLLVEGTHDEKIYPTNNTIVDGRTAISKDYSLPLISSMYPQTEKIMKKFNISSKGIIITKSPEYLKFLHPEVNTTLILTDPGGLQEGTHILVVPCTTHRDNTERSDIINAGEKTDGAIERSQKMVSKGFVDEKTYGDGRSQQKNNRCDTLGNNL